MHRGARHSARAPRQSAGLGREAALRPALHAVVRRWTDAYLDVLAWLLKAAGSTKPAADAELLIAAADGLMIEQLATGDRGDPAPRLRRLATVLVTRT